MKMFVECEDCKHIFEVCSDNIVYKREFKVEGKSIFLTYYDCPSCGRRHFVQIDDVTSNRKYNEVRKMFIKLSVAKRKGEEIPEKQLEKFKKARIDLSSYRMNLMKEYTGKSIYDETEFIMELRFSCEQKFDNLM